MLFADCLLTPEKTIEFVDVKDGTFSIFLHGYERLLNDFRIPNDQNTKQEMSLKQENTKLTPVLPRHFLLKRQMNNYSSVEEDQLLVGQFRKNLGVYGGSNPLPHPTSNLTHTELETHRAH